MMSRAADRIFDCDSINLVCRFQQIREIVERKRNHLNIFTAIKTFSTRRNVQIAEIRNHHYLLRQMNKFHCILCDCVNLGAAK